MAFKQEHILSSIVTCHAKFPGMLFGGKDGQGLREFGNPSDPPVAFESSRDGNPEVLRLKKFRCHISQLVELNIFVLLINSSKHAEINIPGLIHISLGLGFLIQIGPLLSFLEIHRKPLKEVDFTHSFRWILHPLVQISQTRDHSFRVLIGEVGSTGLFDCFRPGLRKQNSGSNKFLRNHICLLDKSTLRQPQFRNESLCCLLAISGPRLFRNGKTVH